MNLEPVPERPLPQPERKVARPNLSTGTGSASLPEPRKAGLLELIQESFRIRMAIAVAIGGLVAIGTTPKPLAERILDELDGQSTERILQEGRKAMDQMLDNRNQNR